MASSVIVTAVGALDEGWVGSSRCSGKTQHCTFSGSDSQPVVLLDDGVAVPLASVHASVSVQTPAEPPLRHSPDDCKSSAQHSTSLASISQPVAPVDAACSTWSHSSAVEQTPLAPSRVRH